MVAFVVKILASLLIIVLITSSVVTEKFPMKNRNGNNGRTPSTKSGTEDYSQAVTGIRRAVINGFLDPNKDCYKKFFVGRSAPLGLRGGAWSRHNTRYICQQVNHETYYGTMFDEGTGIPVFSAYTLTKHNIKFQDRNPSKWKKTEGIGKQGNDFIYPSLPYHRGHLVPKKTYSSTPDSVRSTYTYTNAVPQRPAFNSGQWAQFEKRVRKYAEICTKKLNGKLYLLTGTSFAHFELDIISNRVYVTHPTVEKLGDYIYIPNSMWTAGCCEAENKKDTRNFAVIGNNVEDPDDMHTQQIRVQLLQRILLDDVAEHGIGDPPFGVSLFPGNRRCSKPQRNVILPKLKNQRGVNN